ncbi:MAG: hypothetical protein ACE5I1_11530 [bacterium]
MHVRIWHNVFRSFFAFVLLTGCLNNPFGSSEISGEKREIKGSVALRDGANPERVYIWLEGFQIGIFSGSAGEFTIKLPPKGNQGSPTGTDGLLRLYFYLANYKLTTRQVIVNNSEFVYNRADVNKNGDLAGTTQMRRFLRISTSLSPPVIQQNYNGNIEMATTLEAFDDSVTVIFPNAIGDQLGAVLLKNIDTGEVIIYEAIPGYRSRDKQVIGQFPKTRKMAFNLLLKPLLPGKYEVVPYLLISHEPIPESLIESLKAKPEILSQDYLNLPFRRDGDILEVRE